MFVLFVLLITFSFPFILLILAEWWTRRNRDKRRKEIKENLDEIRKEKIGLVIDDFEKNVRKIKDLMEAINLLQEKNYIKIDGLENETKLLNKHLVGLYKYLGVEPEYIYEKKTTSNLEEIKVKKKKKK